MTLSETELALKNATIISFLPIEDWLDSCQNTELRKILLAMLELKRVTQEHPVKGLLCC